MRTQLARQREWTALGKAHGVTNFLFDLVFDLPARAWRKHARDPCDLIDSLPRLELRSGAVTGIVIRVRSDMLPPTVGHALDETCAARTRSHGCDSGKRRCADRQDI